MNINTLSVGMTMPTKTDQSQNVCPNCGYCPHCGRGGYHTYPYWLYQPCWTQPYIWGTTTTGVGGTTSKNLNYTVK
jgi:hypothetical protein